MKKLFLCLFALSFLLVTACSKDDDPEPQFGSIDVTLSYYYNAFQGYRPDVGAKVYLFKKTGKTYEVDNIDYMIGYLEVVGTGEKVSSDFKTEADVTGKARIENIPYGSYMIVAASKGRFVYSKKDIEINSPTQTLVKNFGYLREFEDSGESW